MLFSAEKCPPGFRPAIAPISLAGNKPGELVGKRVLCIFDEPSVSGVAGLRGCFLGSVASVKQAPRLFSVRFASRTTGGLVRGTASGAVQLFLIIVCAVLP